MIYCPLLEKLFSIHFLNVFKHFTPTLDFIPGMMLPISPTEEHLKEKEPKAEDGHTQNLASPESL